MYDLIIKNGSVIDGTGKPAFVSDVAIKDGKIVRVGKNLTGAIQIIDATGLTVTPGFIDSHSHSDNALKEYPDVIEKIEQGITTAIAGQCGNSVAPTNEEGMDAFVEAHKDCLYGCNTALLVGHNNLRKVIIGPGDKEPSREEMEAMKTLLRNGLEHGAMGISFGLIYSPGCYAKTPELMELAKVVKEYDGIVAAHIRNEGKTVVEATAEFIEVIKQSGTRGVLSHHKSSGGKIGPDGRKANWGKVKETLKMIEEAKIAAKRYAVAGFEVGVLIMLLMLGINRPYVYTFFTDLTEETRLVTVGMITVYALYMPFRSMASAMIIGSLRGLRDSVKAMYYDVLPIYLWAIPIGCLLAFVFDLPITAVLAVMMFKRVIKCVLGWRRLYKL